MAENYLIAIGGTGSRCLEAVIHLAGAGFFRTPLNVLVIDPDQNNGNSVRVRTLITQYHSLSMARQPVNSERKKQLVRWEGLPQPELFQSSINVRSGAAPEQFAFFWHNPNATHRRFGEVIQYEAQHPDFKKFLDLFYEPNDLEMVLDFGYRGRTSVGAVALKQDLEGTAAVPRSGLREFLEKLNIDIQANEARVFVMGSVFGGTGAAGLPTIPQLIGNLSNDVIAHENRQRLL